jgi:hypothetical protein
VTDSDRTPVEGYHVVVLEDQYGRADILGDVLVTSVDGVKLTKENVSVIVEKLQLWANQR